MRERDAALSSHEPSRQRPRDANEKVSPEETVQSYRVFRGSLGNDHATPEPYKPRRCIYLWKKSIRRLYIYIKDYIQVVPLFETRLTKDSGFWNALVALALAGVVAWIADFFRGTLRVVKSSKGHRNHQSEHRGSRTPLYTTFLHINITFTSQQCRNSSCWALYVSVRTNRKRSSRRNRVTHSFLVKILWHVTYCEKSFNAYVSIDIVNIDMHMYMRMCMCVENKRGISMWTSDRKAANIYRKYVTYYSWISRSNEILHRPEK